MTKFAVAFLFAALTLAPMLIAQAEESRPGRWSEDLRRARARLNARMGRLGWPLARLLHVRDTGR
jgi:hypothetical protein